MGKNEGFANLEKKKVHDVWLRDRMDQRQLVSFEPNTFLFESTYTMFFGCFGKLLITLLLCLASN